MEMREGHGLHYANVLPSSLVSPRSRVGGYRNLQESVTVRMCGSLVSRRVFCSGHANLDRRERGASTATVHLKVWERGAFVWTKWTSNRSPAHHATALCDPRPE